MSLDCLVKQYLRSHKNTQILKKLFNEQTKDIPEIIADMKKTMYNIS